MRYAFPLSCLVAALCANAAPADDGAPPAQPPAVKRAKPMEPRRFEKGHLTDPYWGVTYDLPDVEEKKADRQAGKLLDGAVGRVQIEIGIWEYADEMTAAQRRDAERKKWEEKHREMKDVAQGDDPAPWVTFQEPSPSGAIRRHGYSWTVRGCRAFVVHAHVAADAEGGAEGVKAALGGLKVGPETGASVIVQVVSKESQMPYDDPGVLATAAQRYLDDKATLGARPAIAESLLARAIESLPGSPLARKPGGELQVYSDLAGAQMKLKKYDESVATLTKCLDLATKTERPGPDGAIVQYNLACAWSLAGKLDEAFAALEKAFPAAEWAPTPLEHAIKDEDLANCRKDARWQKFVDAHAPAGAK
jgi:tetratricopeptide (TPR) repeat protein